jgi:hypothetical protein
LSLQDLGEESQWLAMPERAYEAKQKLGEAFRVENCPMLVIIDPEGNVVTTEGCEIVSKDTDGEVPHHSSITRVLPPTHAVLPGSTRSRQRQ